MSIVKIIGLGLLILTGIGAGIYASAELNRRADSLEYMVRLIEYIAAQIRYTAAPIQEILVKAASTAEFASLPFLYTARKQIKSGSCPDDALTVAIEKDGKACGFTTRDKELTLHFSRELGKSDIEGQLSHCEAFQHLFEDRLQSAREDVHMKGKLYITLGAAGGIGAALLML